MKFIMNFNFMNVFNFFKTKIYMNRKLFEIEDK